MHNKLKLDDDMYISLFLYIRYLLLGTIKLKKEMKVENCNHDIITVPMNYSQK